MIGLFILYAAFMAGGLFLFNIQKKLMKKETIVYVGSTTVGAVLWGSIIMQHPLDLNEMIAWLIDRLQ